MKKIVTHNGIFHSDEITAIALLKVFGEDDYIIDRLPHQTSIEKLDKYDYVIDIGRKYDGVKYYDHHQNSPKEDSRASAGLIWDYLLNGLESEYEEIYSFVKQVDNNDLGLAEPESHSIISLVKSLNTTELYSKEQGEAFMFAIEIVTKYIQSLKTKIDIRVTAYHSLMQCNTAIIEDKHIMVSDEFIPEWQYHLAGSSEINYFMWFDNKQDKWKIQSVPVKYGSFEFKSSLEPSKANDNVDFVHNGKFFAVGTYYGLMDLVDNS